MKDSVKRFVKFPSSVLQPVRDYLMSEEKRLSLKEKNLKKEDPFSDVDRGEDNAAVDTEVNELVGHERVQAIKLEVGKTLINIRKALTRINLGSYGTCAKCGKMIDTDRLAVNPTAEFCVDCEQKEESKKRR